MNYYLAVAKTIFETFRRWRERAAKARKSGLAVLALIAAATLAACVALPAGTPAPAVSADPVSATQKAAMASPQPAAGDVAALEAANMALVRRFYDEFSAGRSEVIVEVHAMTLTMHYAGAAEPVPAQALADDLAAIKKANPDLRAEIHDMFAAGDYVFTELTWTTTHTGDLFGIPATGKTMHHPGIVVRRLEDGKIVESWEIWDDLTLLNSIGYLPSWDEAIASGPMTQTTPTATP